MWLPPGNMQVTDERAAETGLERLPELLGLEAATRLFAALSLVEPYHRTDVPVDHWYLFVVGVDRKKLSRTPTRPRNARWSISAVHFRWWAAPMPSGRLSALAEESGADEIRIATTTYDASDRTRSYELVANAFGMGAAGKEER